MEKDFKFFQPQLVGPCDTTENIFSVAMFSLLLKTQARIKYARNDINVRNVNRIQRFLRYPE